mmetsp:Transcript_15031/g.34236  ORF Transcript_15031/g.34236 Transcript_15031/m.34236 type:complete len:149 (+) Transcript_15031:1496-1942(+)
MLAESADLGLGAVKLVPEPANACSKTAAFSQGAESPLLPSAGTVPPLVVSFCAATVVDVLAVTLTAATVGALPITTAWCAALVAVLERDHDGRDDGPRPVKAGLRGHAVVVWTWCRYSFREARRPGQGWTASIVGTWLAGRGGIPVRR